MACLRPCPIEKSEIDINSQIGLSISELKTSLEDKELVVQCEVENAVLYHDLKLFHYAMCNMLENAIRLSYQSGIIKIAGIKQADIAYQISILCSGKGFSDSVLKNANKLFFDDDFIDENPGLVLYTIRLILKEMQGDLLLENNTTGGTKVQMIFNLMPENQISGDARESNINELKLSRKIHESC